MSMFKTMFGRALAAIGLLGAATGAAAAPAKPALWAVSDADTTVYLFGTIHLLPQNYQWRSARLDQAVAQSDQLVVETIIDEAKPLEMMNALSSLAYSKGLPPIADRVPAAKRAALDAAIKQSGVPRAAFDRMESWAAAFMLLGNQFKAMGLKSGAGVESVLRTSFAAQGKSVGQLETNREQLSFFDGLPEPAQRALLEGAIEAPTGMNKDFNRMLAAWARGDVGAIAATFNRDLASSPAMRDALLDRRNANWTRWVAQRMARPGSVMVAVGAGHLAGRNSLLDLLKRQGMKVRRLQ